MTDALGSRPPRPEDTPEFAIVAERLRRAGQYDRAIEMCREGLKKFPSQIAARVVLGRALGDKGESAAAAAELTMVLREAPDNLPAIRALADLNERADLPPPVLPPRVPQEAPGRDGRAASSVSAAPAAPSTPRTSRHAAFSAHVPGASLGTVARPPRPPVFRPTSLLPETALADTTPQSAPTPATPPDGAVPPAASPFASFADIEDPPAAASPFAALDAMLDDEAEKAASPGADPTPSTATEVDALERLLRKVKVRQVQVQR